jgi:hypothetical protein
VQKSHTAEVFNRRIFGARLFWTAREPTVASLSIGESIYKPGTRDAQVSPFNRLRGFEFLNCLALMLIRNSKAGFRVQRAGRAARLSGPPIGERVLPLVNGRRR